VGTTWYTNLTSKYTLGSESKRSFSNKGLDVAAISATAGGYVWRNGSNFYHQGGEFYPAVGSSVCADGSYTGEVCSVKVQSVDICTTFSDGVTTCHLTKAHRSAINVSVSGDSGGPVYGGTSGSETYIAGTIVGGAESNTTVYYQKIDSIDSAFGLAIKR
jgi:hypothetical protein